MITPSEESAPYVRDIAYRSNFVPGQAPVLLSYVAAAAGFAPPDPAAPFRYLELGCGSGVTLNALAAAYPHGEFVGVDFNSQNVAAARAQAAAAGLGNVTYIEAAFSRLDAGAIEPVHYVACNGTYSWLDATERAALIATLGSALRPGGLLYLGYVTLGRATVTPMWQVLRRLVPASGTDSTARIAAAIDLAAELRNRGALYLQQNAEALTLVNEVHGQRVAGDRAALENLAHNLFAEGLKIELLDEVAAALSPLGFAFCGSATPFLNDPDLALPAELRELHDRLPSRIAQELLKDFMRATRVRTDVFVRSGGPDAASADRYLAQQACIALVGDPVEIWRQLERPDWTAFSYGEPAIRFVFDRLAAEGSACVADLLPGAPFAAAALRAAFHKLVAAPGVELCLSGRLPAVMPLPARVTPASRFNELALDAACAGVAVVQMASPALGSCVPLTLPASLLVADICRHGLADAPGVMHARLRPLVARIPGLPDAAVTQFAEPGVFAQIHRAVLERALPMLLRFGILKAN